MMYSAVTVLVVLAAYSEGLGPPKGRFVQLAGENRLNALVDEIIYEQGVALIKQGKDKIKLPDLDKKFEKHIVGKLELEAEVHLENGWFKNTTSLYRIGDVNEKDNPDGSMVFNFHGLLLAAWAVTAGRAVNVIHTPPKMTLRRNAYDTPARDDGNTATFGMRTLQVGHEDFSWKMWLFHGSGDMDAECDDNAIHFQLTVSYDEEHNCKVNLDEAKLTKLGGFKVTFEPVGFINKIKSKLFTCALNTFAPKIKSVVNAHLEDSLREALKKIDICSMLPF